MRGLETVIEFGTSKIVCATASEKSAAAFEVLGCAQVPYSGIKNSNWLDSKYVSDALGDALSELENRSGTRIKEAQVGLPGCFTRLYTAEVDTAVKGKVTDKEIDILYRKGTPIDLPEDQIIVNQYVSWFMLDDGELYIDAYGKHSTKVSASVVSVVSSKFFIEDIKTLLKNNGVKCKGIICEPLAQALSLVPEDIRDGVCVLADVGYYNTNLSLLYGDSVIHLDTLEIGGGYITGDIAYAMKDDKDTAEKLKRQFSFGLQEDNDVAYMYAKDKSGRLKKYSYSLLSEAIEARTKDILEIISDRVAVFEQKLSRSIPIYFTGGGLNFMPGINSFMSTVCSQPTALCKVDNTVLAVPNMHNMYALLDYAMNNDEDSSFDDSEKKGLFSFFRK